MGGHRVGINKTVVQHRAEGTDGIADGGLALVLAIVHQADVAKQARLLQPASGFHGEIGFALAAKAG